MLPVIISVQHLRITGLLSVVLWSNLPLLMGMVLRCHLLRLSSGLQLTETNSSVLTSCDISSESFALSLGEAVFSGLWSGCEDEASQHDAPRGVVPTCFYFSAAAMLAGRPLSLDYV